MTDYGRRIVIGVDLAASKTVEMLAGLICRRIGVDGKAYVSGDAAWKKPALNLGAQSGWAGDRFMRTSSLPKPIRAARWEIVLQRRRFAAPSLSRLARKVARASGRAL